MTILPKKVIFFLDKVVKLVGGGSVINGAYPNGVVPRLVFLKSFCIKSITCGQMKKKIPVSRFPDTTSSQGIIRQNYFHLNHSMAN